MKTRPFVLSAGVATVVACSPAEKPPVAPTATTPPTMTAAPAPEPEPPYVYYRLVQAGPVDLVVDEVRLDGAATKCFQAHRRVVGGFAFEQGKDALDANAATSAVKGVVDSWQQWNKQGKKPTLVLHGHADHDEADDADAARALSVKRAEAVKAALVKEGIPADLVQVVGHGWDLSAAPLRPSDTLQPNRRVEISADNTSPSESKVTQAAPLSAEALTELQSRVRALEGESTPPGESLHAPRVMLVVNDASGKLELEFDLTSAAPEALALQRYFMQGLSNDCKFDTVSRTSP